VPFILDPFEHTDVVFSFGMFQRFHVDKIFSHSNDRDLALVNAPSFLVSSSSFQNDVSYR
jgi:hypothetical protein